MYEVLMGEPFPGKEKIDEKREIEFHRRAVERCWTRIRRAAKTTRPDCVIWLSCHDLSHPQVAGSKMFREVDWLMNEHPDPVRLEAVRKTAGPRTRIIQCLCGWGPKHDAAKVARDPRFSDVGFYGFAWPDAKTTLPPTLEQAGDNERLVGNARNIEALRKVFHMARPARGGSPSARPAEMPELASPKFVYSPAAGLGFDEAVTRRDPSDVIRVGSTYHVWYTKTAHGHSGYDATIWHARSTDGLSWTEQGEALPRGEAGAWDAASVFTPNILVAKGRYYLFYTAIPEHEVLEETPTAIGVAAADSPAGPWVRCSENPILRVSERPETFDSFRVDDACLIVRGGRYWLYYKGRQQGRSPRETKMGVAIADEPTGPFIKSFANPVVDSGHEVLVWPHRSGVAALIAPVGPQRNTVQYAPDGIHFSPAGRVKDVPKAPGAFRSDAFADPRSGEGIRWGISMKHRPRPHLLRFDCNMRVADRSGNKSAGQRTGGWQHSGPSLVLQELHRRHLLVTHSHVSRFARPRTTEAGRR